MTCVQPHRRSDLRFGEASTRCPSPLSEAPLQKDRSNDSSEEEQYRARATCQGCGIVRVKEAEAVGWGGGVLSIDTCAKRTMRASGIIERHRAYV